MFSSLGQNEETSVTKFYFPTNNTNSTCRDFTERKIIIESEDLKKLICDSCGYYLSIGPIRLSNQKYTCGRCRGEGYRIKPFELILKYFQFSCINDKYGCSDLLKWGSSVETHERLCKYKPIICPGYPPNSCRWTGTVFGIENHFQQEHFQLLMPSPGNFAINAIANIEINYISSCLQSIFLVKLKLITEDMALHCKVELIDTLSTVVEKKFSYSVKYKIHGVMCELPPKEISNYNVHQDENTTNCVTLDIEAFQNLYRLTEVDKLSGFVTINVGK